MPFVEYAVPSGGRVWFRTRLTHAQAVARRAAFAAALSPAALRALTASSARGVPAEQAVAEEVDIAAALTSTAHARATSLRQCIVRWEDVRGPDGDELAFPQDIEALYEADFDAIYIAAEAALDVVDPKATAETSA